MDRTDLFKKVNDIIEQENIQVLKIRALQIGEAINETHSIDVAVLGEFKAGKSSFINSFVGREVLPVGVIPVTSVITRIGLGQIEKALVRYYDGKDEHIEVDTVNLFVNESKNPDNVKRVDYVDITLPELHFLNGLHLVDTPGLGSFWKHNTETTKHWFVRVGVAIVAISTERPLSSDEMNLIRDISEATPEVVILLTKTDLFPENELNKIESYITSSINSTIGKNLRIFRYSLRKDTALYKQNILKSLIEPLRNSFDLKRDEILDYKMASLTKQCISYLEIAKLSSLHSEEEREKLKKEIFDRRINRNFVAREMALVMSDELNGVRDRVLDILQDGKESLIKRLEERFINDYKEMSGNLYKRTGKFERWMTEMLGVELANLVDNNNEKFEKIVDDAGEHLGFFAKSFRNSLKDKVKDILNVELPVEDIDIGYEKLKTPDIKVSWTFESHLDLLWFLFPMSVFGGMFRRYFKKQIPREVEINLYRLASGINALISKAVTGIKEQSLKYIMDELETIETVLTKTTSKSEYYEQIIKELSKMLNQVR